MKDAYEREEAAQDKAASKELKSKERMPEPSNSGPGKKRDGLRDITLDGSGRARYPKPKKLNKLGY